MKIDRGGPIRGRRWSRWLVLLAALAPMTACGQEVLDPSNGRCPKARHIPTDVGFYVGFDWDEETHRFGESGTVVVCTAGSGADLATLTAPDGVTVTPATGSLPSDPVKIVTFTVTVPVGRNGPVNLSLLRSAGGERAGGGTGPLIVADEQGWRFVPQEDD